MQLAARTLNKTSCDTGVCDECMRRYRYSTATQSCPGVVDYVIFADQGPDSVRDLCLYELMQCRARERSGLESLGPLVCDLPFRDWAAVECAHWTLFIDYCNEWLRMGTSWGDPVFKKCFFHQNETNQYYNRPHFWVRDYLNTVCAASGSHLNPSNYLPAAPPGSTPTGQLCGDRRTTCPLCVGGGVRCASQKCQLDSVTVPQNFNNPPYANLPLEVSCGCSNPNSPPHSQFTVTKKESGYVEFEWPTLFTCEHKISVQAQRENGALNAAQSAEVSRVCGIRTQYGPEATAFNLDGVPAGTKYVFSVVGTVNVNAAAFVAVKEVATLRRNFWVPFEASVSARILTRDRGGVALRAFRFVFTPPTIVGSSVGWGEPVFYSASGAVLNKTQATAGGWTVTATTDAQGVAFARVVWPTDNIASTFTSQLQAISVFYEPAATEGGQMLSYDGCAAPCSVKRVNDVRHGESAPQVPTIEFIDATAITLRGAVPFVGTADCFADDIEVRVLNVAGTLIKTEKVTANGVFAIPVQRNVPFKLQFARNSTPPYVFVDPSSRLKVTAGVDVAASASDVNVLIPFAAAMQEHTPLPSVALVLAGGLCEFEFPTNAAFNVRMTAPSCANGVARGFTAALSHGDRRVTIQNVPPLRFTGVTLNLSIGGGAAVTNDINTYFRAKSLLNSQVLDARVPTVKAEDAAAVNRTGAPVSVLREQMALLLPLAGDIVDSSPYAHGVVRTAAADLAFNGTREWLVVANQSALTLGRNTIVDLSGAATIAMRLRVISLQNAMVNATLLNIADVTHNRAAGGGALELKIAPVPNLDESFELFLNIDNRMMARTGVLELRRSLHIAVRIVDGAAPSFVIDGVPTTSMPMTRAWPQRWLSQCTAAFQYDCVREFTLGATHADAAPRWSGALSDVAIWTRSLADADLAFVAAASADNVRLSALLGAPLPRFVYRAPVQVELPAESVRYWPPIGGDSEESVAPKTLAELVAGEQLGFTACTTKDLGAPKTNIHVVQQNGAVSVLAHSFEEYFGKRCYLVRGVSRMRSTFTASCLPHDMADDTAMPCQGPMGKNAYGYSYFNAIVGDPKLLPRDPTRTDNGASRRLDEYSFGEIKAFLGEYRFMFEGFENTASKSLWFHVRGFKGPDFPSIYSLPMNDVPILRLYRPPGDRSQAFLSRSWAKSVKLSFSREDGTEIRASGSLTSRFTAGVDITNCFGGGVGVGFGAVVFALTMVCLDNKASAYVDVALKSSYTDKTSQSVSLAEAFSSNVLTQFETAVHDRTVGKWGDIVVTVGITILVTDSFFNQFNKSQCMIDQLYAPEWKPGDENMIDSLQVTPRVGVQPIIDDWRTQIEVMSRDCGGMLSGALAVVYPADFAATNLTQCTAINASGQRVPVTDVDEVAKKFMQASAAVLRWSAILQNWEATFCAALKAADTPDYYATDGRPPCSAIDSAGIEIGAPEVWNLLGDATSLATFEERLASASDAIDTVIGASSLQQQLCDKSSDELDALGGPLGISLVEAKGELSCGTGESTYAPLPKRDGVYKVALTGPASFQYVASATVSSSETYAIGSGHAWSLDAEGGAGTMIKVGPVSAALGFTVGVGGGGSSNTMMGGERESSETTSVGFTIGDDDVNDQIGVNIYADPVYGTPIFVTTGGWTSCPSEPGTNQRQALRVTPETPTPEDAIEMTNEDPDEPFVIDLKVMLDSQRAVDAGASWVYDIQVYFEDDLTVEYKGELVGIDSRIQFQVSNTDFTTFGPIRVKRGKRFDYKGVMIAGVSECDDGVSTLLGVLEGVYYNFKWQPKCALAEIDTRQIDNALFPSARPFFVINDATSDLTTVRVRNPLPQESPWTLIDGTFTVQVQYRAVGEQTQWADVPNGVWQTPQYCKNDARIGSKGSCYKSCPVETPKCCRGVGELCDAARTCCGDVDLQCRSGLCQYSFNATNVTVTFDASQLRTNEGMYELRALTLCGVGLETASEPVPGRIDRVPPRLFGAFQEPADRLWWPGDKIALRFTEDVLCDRPFAFAASIAIDGGAVKPVGTSVDIICTTNTIEVAFSRTLISAPDELIGKEVTLRVADVADLALNRIAAAAEWSFTVGAFDESAVSVTLSDIRVPLTLLADNDTDINAAVARMLAGPDGPFEQLSVSSGGGAITRRRQAVASRSFDIVVAPSTSVVGGRSAVRFAGAILARSDVDSRNAGVSMSGPAQPESEPFFETAGGIAVIVVLVLVGLLLIGALVAFLLLRHKKQQKAVVADEPKPTELQSMPTKTDSDTEAQSAGVPRRTLSHRGSSRRSQRKSAAPGVATSPAQTPTPPMSDNASANDEAMYTPLPIYRGSPAYNSSTAPRAGPPERLSSRRKRSSRRRAANTEMAAIPTQLQEN
jgi:hypothetical protein